LVHSCGVENNRKQRLPSSNKAADFVIYGTIKLSNIKGSTTKASIFYTFTLGPGKKLSLLQMAPDWQGK